MMFFSATSASLFAFAQISGVIARTNAAYLNLGAKSAGKEYFGTATDNPELDDPAYVDLLRRSDIFGQLTPANSMKWDATEPEQGVFDFSGADQLVALAQETGKIIRGHNLVSHSQIPDWVTYGSWTQENLTSVIINHVQKQVSRYKGQIYAWDVINEHFEEDGSPRASVFYNILGESYIDIALRAAHAADPNAELYINDYNLERTGPKIDAMVQLVQDLLAAGTPIHGIGFEGHLILRQVNASVIQSNMERITRLGLRVAMTEIDVRIPLPATKVDLVQQKEDYMSVVQACLAVDECVGLTLWGCTDKYSWIPSTFPGYGAACPWDANMNTKPAHDGIAMALASYIA